MFRRWFVGHRAILALFAILALSGAAARADQALWNTEDITNKADKLLEYGLEIRFYCAPCGDKAYRREVIADKETAAVDTPGHFELRINGNGVDLAYVYLEKDGKWVNVGKEVGAEVDSVPEVLPDTVPAGLDDFDRVKYVGTLDGRLSITLELSKYEQGLNGTYYYSHIGQALTITGTIDGVGTFNLDETDNDGNKTGTFIGKLTEQGGRAEGTWATPDGSKSMPFSVKRVALHGEENGGIAVGSQGAETHLDFPVFLPGGSPAYAALNTEIQRTLRSRAMEYTQQFVESAAELGLEVAPQFAGEYAQTIAVGDHQIRLLNDNLVSLLFLVTLYQGGAHGITTSLPLNLRILKAGEAQKVAPIALSELLAPGDAAWAALSDYVIAALKKKNASLVVEGQIKALKPEELANFTLSPRGITVYFDPYAVASYAEGAFDVFVPFDELASAFNTEAIKALVNLP